MSSQTRVSLQTFFVQIISANFCFCEERLSFRVNILHPQWSTVSTSTVGLKLIQII